MFVVPIQSHWDKITAVLFNLGQYDKYREIYDTFIRYIKELIPGIDIQISKKLLTVNGITITEEI